MSTASGPDGSADDLDLLRSMNRAIEGACHAAKLHPGLPRTCRLDDGPPFAGIDEIRVALVQDLVDLGLRLAGPAHGPSSENKDRAFGALMIIQVALAEPDPLAWGMPLEELVTAHWVCEPLSADAECGVYPRALLAMARGLSRLRTEVDDARVDGSDPTKGPGNGAVFSRPVSDSLLALHLQAAEETTGQSSRDRGFARIARGVELLAEAWKSWAGDATFPLTSSAASTLGNAGTESPRSDPLMLLAILRPALEVALAENRHGSSSLTTLALLTSLCAARDQGELQRLIKARVLDLPAWTTPLLFDANADLPILSSGRIRLNGDLLVGYNGHDFGAAIRGSALTYDTTRPIGTTQTDRTEGSLETWWQWKPSPPVAAELRVAGQIAFYDTTVTSRETTVSFRDETSLMGRGSLLAGLRLTPSTTWAFGAWVGGGVQHEMHDGLRLEGEAASLSDDAATTSRGEGRWRVQWNPWPEIISVRVRGDVSWLQISSDISRVLVAAGTTESTQSSGTSSQLEVANRLFVDLDALKVFDFRPSLNFGIDTIRIDSKSTHQFAAGLGVRREAF